MQDRVGHSKKCFYKFNYLTISYEKINSHDDQIYATNEPSVKQMYRWLY